MTVYLSQGIIDVLLTYLFTRSSTYLLRLQRRSKLPDTGTLRTYTYLCVCVCDVCTCLCVCVNLVSPYFGRCDVHQDRRTGGKECVTVWREKQLDNK